MSSVNKVIIIGRLGQDPDVKSTQSGQSVCNLSVATDESWTDKSGTKQEKTEWHRVVVWGRTAELCGEYLTKGRLVYVEGRLETREWADKDNNRRFSTEIKADRVQFLDSGASSGDRGDSAPTERRETRGVPARESVRSVASGPQGGSKFDDDDLPF